MTEVLRLAAFSTDPAGGNPAGVVLDASASSDEEMQRIAAEVGYAETAFVVRPPTEDAPRSVAIRYFSPTAEVPFCGHATIATAVVLAEKVGTPGAFDFATPVGPIRIDTTTDTAGRTVAAFTSVPPTVAPIDDAVLDRLLRLLHVATADGAARPLSRADLDQRFPPMLASAGNTHPVVVLSDRAVFDAFAFDPAAVRQLMDEQGWAGTVTVLHLPAEQPGSAAAPMHTPGRPDLLVEARNLFPVGTLIEDPATGSAAASVGGWLRATEVVRPPARVHVLQGRHVGRPGLLVVDVPETGGIVVSGTAVVIG